jgi:hypothetical protein
MELATKTLRTAEEDTRLRRSVDLADGSEDHVPVGTAEVGRSTESSNGVLVCIGIVDHDVGSVVGFNLCGQILLFVFLSVTK